MLHLIAAEQLGMLTERPPLAISSCGNAALAAATVASWQEWPLRVLFRRGWMTRSVVVLMPLALRSTVVNELPVLQAIPP